LLQQQERAAAKAQREKDKKLLRKERQALRAQTTEAGTLYFANASTIPQDDDEPLLWIDAYDMQQDVEYLCTNLSLEELNQLNEDFETAGLPLVHQLTVERKAAANAAESAAASSMTQSTNGTSSNSSKNNGGSSAVLPWRAQELSALAKATKKYPAGLASRWDAIAQVVNTTCRPEIPRTREACIEKFNQMARIRGPAATATTTSTVDKTTVAAATATNATAAVAATIKGQHNGVNGAGTRDSTDAAAATTKAIDNSASKESSWTAEQDRQLQDALALYPASMEKNERWTAIAAAVPGQSKKSCVQRFKAIREALLQAKK
jgi:DnaJ homolog subfamily C member 2